MGRNPSVWRDLAVAAAVAGASGLADHRYSAAGLLGATPFMTSGDYVARPFATPVIDGERPMVHAAFVAPGAPRAWLVGLRYRLGAR
jgi:hypothetical protein